MPRKPSDLDQIDRKILNCLQRDCRITNADLAAEVGTSAPSCMRRTRRLRTEGYIEREIALVNPEKVGSNLISISEVKLNNHERQARDNAIRHIRSIPEVTFCLNVTGDCDLMFVAMLSDMEEFAEKITEPLTVIPEIASINSYFAIKTIKFEPFLHFDETR